MVAIFCMLICPFIRCSLLPVKVNTFSPFHYYYSSFLQCYFISLLLIVSNFHFRIFYCRHHKFQFECIFHVYACGRDRNIEDFVTREKSSPCTKYSILYSIRKRLHNNKKPSHGSNNLCIWSKKRKVEECSHHADSKEHGTFSICWMYDTCTHRHRNARSFSAAAVFLFSLLLLEFRFYVDELLRCVSCAKVNDHMCVTYTCFNFIASRFSPSSHTICCGCFWSAWADDTLAKREQISVDIDYD